MPISWKLVKEVIVYPYNGNVCNCLKTTKQLALNVTTIKDVQNILTEKNKLQKWDPFLQTLSYV